MSMLRINTNWKKWRESTDGSGEVEYKKQANKASKAVN